MAVFNAVFHGDETFNAVFASSQPFSAKFNTVVEVTGDAYAGSYEWTPTNEYQIIPTMGMNMIDNVVINPIPSNYGLIEYDGSVIRVS